MPLPDDYLDRVYAGVLGKIIGVYLGRPFEGWSYERITSELGEIRYYVHDRLGKPLVVTDDDISGTFTFIRALPDYGNDSALTPEQIGQTWLNYIVENRTILWWGGMGNSTEHTAYLRLKSGVPAPRSGSMALNGKVVAEQIGAQIFIDSWAMVAPGDPELAADLARRAGSVSHDGEAIYAAQALAAMESQAFVERDLDSLLDCALSLIPSDSVIHRMIGDVREWHAAHSDWRETRELIAAHYGYDKYGGNCHVVPNHALIVLGLLYGDGDFQRSLMIANTSGWDTDCNSGNLGCLLGIRNGLEGIDRGPDWRGPVADRMYLSTADGGNAVTNAPTQALRIANMGRSLAGLPPLQPKRGARYHFELPGSVQGWRAYECGGDATVEIENVAGHSAMGSRSLEIRYNFPAVGTAVRAGTDTFTPPEALDMPGYGLMACPSLYPGQALEAYVIAGESNHLPVTCRLFVEVYDAQDQLRTLRGPETAMTPGFGHELSWKLPETDGQPIAAAGIELDAEAATAGSVHLDYLTWRGTPDIRLARPSGEGTAWRRAWVNGADHFGAGNHEPFRLMQDHGTGMLIHGSRDWTDYKASASITVHMAESAGIAVRVQGLARYYALLLSGGNRASLVKELDGTRTLAEAGFEWELDRTYELEIEFAGNTLSAGIDGKTLFEFEDTDRPLVEGAIGLVCREGRVGCDEVMVRPL